MISLDIAVAIINNKIIKILVLCGRLNVMLFLWATHLNLAEKCVPELLFCCFIHQSTSESLFTSNVEEIIHLK